MKVSTDSLTLRHHCSCKTKRSCTCSPECQVHHFTYVLQYIIVWRRVQWIYKPKGRSCSELSIVRVLLMAQRFLNHVDPIGQKCLAYLEYNRCQGHIFELNYHLFVLLLNCCEHGGGTTCEQQTWSAWLCTEIANDIDPLLLVANKSYKLSQNQELVDETGSTHQTTPDPTKPSHTFVTPKTEEIHNAWAKRNTE